MITREEKGNVVNDDGNKSKACTTSTSTTSWTRLKDPRIVRVSRAFGGKDRHSKVCTVRGLRDRRVRLSVPTAIQLYNLYPMLGNAHQITTNKEGRINWDNNIPLEPPNNNALGYNPNFFKWDPSNLSLAHSENSLSHQHDHHQNFNLMSSMPLTSHHQPVVYPPGLPQFFHQHNNNINVGASSSSEFDPKEINFQMLSNNSGSENPLSTSTNSFRHSIDSTNQSIRPFHFLPSQNCDDTEPSN